MWKKVTAAVLIICLVCNVQIGPKGVQAADSLSIENAVNWAVGIANDNTYGYTTNPQDRWGPDYDCSSFVISAFKAVGFDTGSAYNTSSIKSQLILHGFVWIPWNNIGSVDNLQRGDILLAEGQHTELYIGNNQNVGAHGDYGYTQTGDQNGKEVSVCVFYNFPWDGVLRYTGQNNSEVSTIDVTQQECDCSTSYAGEYIVTTYDSPLLMRSGHGTQYDKITSIPKGSIVYVSKANGSWAHVQWNGYSGYSSMLYLTLVNSSVEETTTEAITVEEESEEETTTEVETTVLDPSKIIKSKKAVIKTIKNKKKGKVRLYMKKNIEADGFQIKYALNKSMTKKRKYAKTTSYTVDIKKLDKNKNYYFKTRGYIIINNKKTYSKWSDVKKKKVK